MTVMSEKWEKRTLADFATAVCGNNNVVERLILLEERNGIKPIVIFLD